MGTESESITLGVSVRVEAITFSDDKSIGLTPGSTTVLIGPNNSGKTSTLRELYAHLGGRRPGPVVREVVIRKTGDASNLKQWLDKNVSLGRARHALYPTSYSWLGAECAVGGHEGYEEEWKKPDLGGLAGILCGLLPVDERLDYPSKGRDEVVQRFNVLTDAPKDPIQALLMDEELELRVSGLFRNAFGIDLVLNRGVGTDISLHCGERPQLGSGEDRLSRGFVRRVSDLPLLVHQGHGMRSYAGCLMATFASPALVQMTDEPEAFLHGPQARLIGRVLAAEKPQQRQLILATHSGDFLRGVLDSNVENINIIRLTRDGVVNHARQLDAAEIRSLWADPILRFSNVLDGLFHESVVVCEGDADCRFYSAVLAAARSSQEPQPDVLFSSSGGKHRIPVVVSALVGLGVPTRVVADFDVLQEAQTLRRIVEALGAAWGTIESLWREVKSAMDQKAPPLAKNQVQSQIAAILAAGDKTSLAQDDVEAIRKVLRAASSWDLAKQAGVAVVPAGQPRQRANALLAALRSVGLFVVECGELERFAPSVGGEGPRWVAEVLKRDLARDAELEGARSFVADLFSTTVTQRSEAKRAFMPPPSGGSAESPAKDGPRESARFNLKKVGYQLARLFGLKRRGLGPNAGGE